MNTKQWGLVMSYYKACWVDFSPQSLQSVLASDVEMPIGDTLVTRDGVITLYDNMFFSKVDISKTKILSFDVSMQGDIAWVRYRLNQTLLTGEVQNLIFEESLHFNEEFKIDEINRIHVTK